MVSYIKDNTVKLIWLFFFTGTLKGINIYNADSSVEAFIQFICSNNQIQGDDHRMHSNNLFSNHLFDNITAENITVIEIFKQIEDIVYRESDRKQRPLIINQLQQHQEIYFNQVITCTKSFHLCVREFSNAIISFCHFSYTKRSSRCSMEIKGCYHYWRNSD